MAVAAAAMEAAVQSVGILDLCGTPSATLEKKERGKRKREREREGERERGKKKNTSRPFK